MELTGRPDGRRQPQLRIAFANNNKEQDQKRATRGMFTLDEQAKRGGEQRWRSFEASQALRITNAQRLRTGNEEIPNTSKV